MNKLVDKLEYDNSILKQAYNMTIEGIQRNAQFNCENGNLIHTYENETNKV